MKILYMSEGEQAGVMELNKLLSNFADSETYGSESIEAIQASMDDHGFATGVHDSGYWTAVSVDRFNEIVRESK